MSNWQPIETAPKDGTEVLVVFNGQRHVASYGPVWHPDNLRWVVRHPKWDPRDMQMISEIDPNKHQLAYGLRGPTHWMPIPDPPTVAATVEEIEATLGPLAPVAIELLRRMREEPESDAALMDEPERAREDPVVPEGQGDGDAHASSLSQLKPKADR